MNIRSAPDPHKCMMADPCHPVCRRRSLLPPDLLHRIREDSRSQPSKCIHYGTHTRMKAVNWSKRTCNNFHHTHHHLSSSGKSHRQPPHSLHHCPPSHNPDYSPPSQPKGIDNRTTRQLQSPISQHNVSDRNQRLASQHVQSRGDCPQKTGTTSGNATGNPMWITEPFIERPPKNSGTHS